MAESDMRKKVIKALSSLDAVAVENKVGPGTPDINYIGGWIECKWLRRWPKKGGTVKIDHYTPQQRVWARRRAHCGGRVFMLIQRGREWILLHGPVAADILGESTREEIIESSLRYWNKGLVDDELMEAIT